MPNIKKFLDEDGVAYLASLLNNYPDNEILGTVISAIQDALDEKSNTDHTHTPAAIGALPSSTQYVSSFNGQSGAITYVAPVTSVNGQTGAVTVQVYDDTVLAGRVTALENTAWYRYYTGSSEPSNSMGNNGDLYFQTE